MRRALLPLLVAGLPGCLWINDDDLATRTAELTDQDGDGYQDAAWGGDDCDDSDADVHPGAAEVCDGADNDCNGTVDDDLLQPWYADRDNDGYGDEATLTLACEQPEGYVADATDCDDTEATVNPGADEVCGGGDDDCDGATDEADAVDATTWYADADGDGWGDVADFVVACEQPSGRVADATDCDDSDDAVHPEADESCNGVDDDCDELTDEADATDASTWHQDADADGYGDPEDTIEACEQPEGYVAPEDATDCDDSDDTIHPGALEGLADGDDSDCDGSDDGFTFALIDTRSAQDVVGPRLAQGAGYVFLAWAAEEADDGGTPIYDAVAVDLLDAADPLAGVVDTEDIGGAINVAILGRFDLVANDTLWVTAASWLDLSRRTIRLDAVQIASRATGTYESASTWTMAFDQVQAGLSTLGNVTAVGCGLAGAGMQAVQINAAGVVTGTAIPAVDTVAHDAADDHDVCEYDHVEYMFYAGDSADEHLDYYAFDFGTDTLYSYASDAFPWMITDAEVATDNGFVGVAIGDLDGGNYLYLRAAGTSGSPDDSVFTSSGAPIAALDVSVSPAGIPYVCAVDSVGNASLLWADVLGIPSPALTSVPLTSTDLGAIDDCAVIVTADSVAVFALRGGDDLALGALRVP